MIIAVVLPAYNEAKRLGPVLARLPKRIGQYKVLPIVVDDGSRDGTYEIAKRVPGVRVLRHQANLGKGAAAKTGCDAAYRLGAEFMVLVDADGQHRPKDIMRVVTPLLTRTDPAMAIGAREIGGSMPLAMRLGNTVLTRTARILFGIRSRDSQSGFRAFSRDVYPLIRWTSSSYAMETEMLILAAYNKVATVDISIPTIYLDNYKGTTAFDGLRILHTLLKWKLLWFQEYSLLEPSSL